MGACFYFLENERPLLQKLVHFLIATVPLTRSVVIDLGIIVCHGSNRYCTAQSIFKN